MNFWKTFWACFLAIIISSICSFIFTILVFSSIIFSIMDAATPSDFVLSRNSALTIDLSKPIVDKLSDDMTEYISFPSLEFTPPTTIYNSVEAIKMAAIDPKISGIYIKVPTLIASSTSTIYELREALIEFKENAPDKFIIAYGNNYDQSAVYLTSIADEVYMHPMGGVAWAGMSATTTFYTGTLEKLGIEPQIIRVGTFKSAVEPFMLKKLSDENREQLQSIVDSQWDYIVEEVSAGRNLSPDRLQEAANNLEALTAKGAREVGLVDSLFYIDQVGDRIAERMGSEKPHYISLENYALRYSGNVNINALDKRVELIFASGEIVEKGLGSGGIVGIELARQIATARKDPSVKAIVLRVNSPGGSVIASDEIYREVELAAKEKPLVISMGTYAASGGYWISAPAVKIISNPSTITGSIGVFGTLFSVKEGAEDILGLSFDGVKTNPSADMGSILRPLTPFEKERMQVMINSIYTDFITLVSKNRHMPTQRVDSIAQGRVWTGLQGLNNGLVDEIGTLQDAIKIAAKEAGIEDNYSVSQSKKAEQGFWDVVMSTSASVIEAVLPSSVLDDHTQLLLDQVEQKQGAAQARIPFNINIQ